MTSTPGGGQPPKLIVDTDWKAQAQAEKAKLAGGKPPAPPAASAPAAPPASPAKPAAAPTEGMQVDSDWKRQAQAEKEKLAESGGPGGQPGAARQMEAPQFEDLLSMFVSQALLYLGAIPDPRTGQAVVSLEYAKLYIDLLAVLEDKTKGNLTPEESQTLTRTLQELRMEFVEVTKVVAKAIEEGRLRPQQGAGGPSLKIARAGQVPPPPSAT